MAREVRIAGQEPDDWSESTRAEFADVDEASRRRLHLPSVIARHPTFLPPYMTWAKAVALRGVLDRRANALLALRTGYLCGSEFEWGVHAQTAQRAAGLTLDDIARVAAGPDADGWAPRDRALLRAADELHRDHTISNATWRGLCEEYADDAGALLEVAFVCGHYTMLSMVANTVGVAPEADWQPLPSPRPAGGTAGAEPREQGAEHR
jgi:alkylhydroperoxidase family enzyme